MSCFWISHEWVRARTVSAPRCDRRWDSVLLLTHIDGQTGLNIPEIYEQDLLERRCVNIHVQFRRWRQEEIHHSWPQMLHEQAETVGRRAFLSFHAECLVSSWQSHLPFMVLKRRIPSAGPQIWIRSSLLILKRSAPTKKAAENAAERSCPQWTKLLQYLPLITTVENMHGFMIYFRIIHGLLGPRNLLSLFE